MVSIPESPIPHLAPYARIKRHVIAKIETGAWPVTGKVPSENQLAAQFGVARMTARRALSDLVQEGWLVRSQGLGTFVADRKPVLSMMEVRNIAEEIASRGHRYANRVLKLVAMQATEAIAMYLGINAGARIFHSIIVHIDDDVPVQVEDRYVNPAVAPDYLAQDFARETPNAYLSRVAPIESVEHVIEAMLASSQMARWLRVTPPEPCLKINRRTWSGGQVASYARLTHPGSRYRLEGHLTLARGAASRRSSA
jgi:GntR family histidine utilization transcriptional repressor